MNVEEHAARFRRRLKTMREQAGMSRYALAKKIGCDQSTLHYLESGKHKAPKFHILIGAALALNQSVDHLCGRWDEEK